MNAETQNPANNSDPTLRDTATEIVADTLREGVDSTSSLLREGISNIKEDFMKKEGSNKAAVEATAIIADKAVSIAADKVGDRADYYVDRVIDGSELAIHGLASNIYMKKLNRRVKKHFANEEGIDTAALDDPKLKGFVEKIQLHDQKRIDLRQELAEKTRIEEQRRTTS